MLKLTGSGGIKLDNIKIQVVNCRTGLHQWDEVAVIFDAVSEPTHSIAIKHIILYDNWTDEQKERAIAKTVYEMIMDTFYTIKNVPDVKEKYEKLGIIKGQNNPLDK